MAMSVSRVGSVSMRFRELQALVREVDVPPVLAVHVSPPRDPHHPHQGLHVLPGSYRLREKKRAGLFGRQGVKKPPALTRDQFLQNWP